MEQDRSILFSSDNVFAVYNGEDSDSIFITFNEMGMQANGTKFWGDRVFEKAKISAIGFVSTKPNWYPRGDMEEAIKLLRPIISGRKVITYGFSQGGYGALKYGSLLSARLCFAFSPQWSINPSDVEWFDKRFIKNYHAHLSNGERIETDDLGAENFVVVDSRERCDAANAERIAALGDGVSVIVCPFTGHDTVRIISEAKLASDLINLAREENPRPRDFRNLIRRGRNKSKTYKKGLATRIIAEAGRRPKLVTTVIQFLPTETERKMAFVKMHLSKNEMDLAKIKLNYCTDKELSSINLHECWRIFRNSKFTYGESRIGPLFKLAYPNDVFARLHGVNSLIETGAHDLALSELHELETLDKAADRASFFITFYMSLKRPDLASSFVEGLVRDARITRQQRVEFGMTILQGCRTNGFAEAAISEIDTLKRFCSDDPDRYGDLIETCISMQNMDAAKNLLHCDEASAIGGPLARLYAAITTARTSPAAAASLLQDLLAQEIEDANFWIRTSRLAEGAFGPGLALEALRKAIPCGGKLPLPLCHRFIKLLVKTSNYREAAQELSQINIDNATLPLAHDLAELASTCGQHVLAAKFILLQINNTPHSVDLKTVMMCVISMGQTEAALASRLLDDYLKISSKNKTPSRDEFASLIGGAINFDYLVARKLIFWAHREYPADSHFSSLASRDAFAMKFYSTTPANPPPATPVKRKGFWHFFSLQPLKD